MLSRVLAIHLNFWRPDLERSRRVSMNAFIFSPDGKDFCQFMAPHFPKPMFWAHFHPGLVGAFTFYFSKNLTFGPLGTFKGPPGSTFGPLGPLRALLVPHWGPWGPYAADGSAAAAGRTLNPNQAPLPSRPGTKYVAQGTLAAISTMILAGICFGLR